MKKGLLFVGAIVPLLIFIGLRKNSAPFFSVTSYQCICPEVIAQDYFSSITASLAEKLNAKSSAHELIAHLKEQFPVLKKIIISYRPSAVHVTMTAHEPICCINNRTIFTAQNELFPQDCFSPEAIAGIPHVVVHNLPGKMEPALASFSQVGALLRDLPSDFNCAYDLEFINEHCVHLIDKQEPHFSIALTVDQKKSSTLLSQCDAIKKSIDMRAGFNKGVKWIADTRFADYIVAYKT
jgi:hypothetical protein